MKQITSAEFVSTRWAGGSTTELFIWPPDSSYGNRNFDFRLSTATVEMEQSEFTKLPGYSRKLMILEGATTLKHEGHHTINLNKLDVDSFEGAWNTSTQGRCTDFNVMTRGPLTSLLGGQTLPVNQKKELVCQPDAVWLFIYLHSGSATFSGQITLRKGDLLVLQKPFSDFIEIEAIETSELVWIEILPAAK